MLCLLPGCSPIMVLQKTGIVPQALTNSCKDLQMHELEALGPIDGETARLYAYLFENAQMGVKRSLYANLAIECKQITYLDDTWTPTILVDWLTLEALSQSSVSSKTHPSAECSFYIVRHDVAERWNIRFEHDEAGWPRSVQYELFVNYSGLENDPHPNLKIFGTSPVKMTGISVMRDNFFPKPSSHDDARKMIRPFFPDIVNWQDVHEENEDGVPVSSPRSYGFTQSG